MRGTSPIPPADMARVTLDEAAQHRRDSYEYAALIRAAWTLTQIASGVPSSKWTPPPAWFVPGYQIEEQAA